MKLKTGHNKQLRVQIQKTLGLTGYINAVDVAGDLVLFKFRFCKDNGDFKKGCVLYGALMMDSYEKRNEDFKTLKLKHLPAIENGFFVRDHD